MELDPATMPCYAVLTGLVTPRPVAWVTTVSPAGVVNLAPFSYFNPMGDAPPLVAFAPVRRPDGSRKDTLANLGTCPEFVLNLVTEETVAACNLTSKAAPADESEVLLAGLATVPSTRVRPPRVAGSPAHLECVVRHLLPFGTHPGASTVVLGEVVRVHVEESVLTAGMPDPGKLRAVGRLGGTAWCRTTDRFDLPRP